MVLAIHAPPILSGLLYIGPGIAIGSVITLLGLVMALLFVLYSFVVLPLRKRFRKKKKKDE